MSIFRNFAKWVLKRELNFYAQEASSSIKVIQELTGERDNYEYRAETLKKMVDEYKKKEAIAKVDIYANYVTLPVPRSGADLQAFDAFLAGLSKNQIFLFYLHSLENDILRQFTDKNNSTDAERHRGSLLVIRKIRTDLEDAAGAVEKRVKENAAL